VFRSFWDRDGCYDYLVECHGRYGNGARLGAETPPRPGRGDSSGAEREDETNETPHMDRVVAAAAAAADAAAAAAADDAAAAALGPAACAAAFAEERARPPLAHAAAPPAVFPCDLRRFRAAMVEHGAALGVDAIHALRGDTQVEASPWRPQQHEDDHRAPVPARTRTVRFVTPVDAPFGPKETRGEKVQLCRSYGDSGLVLETRYDFKDIPMGEAFHVTDRWVVEAETAETVRVTVTFELVWTKMCLLKAVVEHKSRDDIVVSLLACRR